MSKSSLYNKFGKPKFEIGGNTPLGEPLNIDPNPLNFGIADWSIIAANAGVDFGKNPQTQKPLYAEVNTTGQTNFTGQPKGSGISFEGTRGTAPLPNLSVSKPDFLTTFGQGNNVITGAPTGTRVKTDTNGNQSSFQPGYGPANATQKIETKKKKNVPYNDLLTLGLGITDMGLGFNEDIQNTRAFNEKLQRRDSKPLYDYNFMYGRTTSGGTEYQPTIKAEMGAKITKRYDSPYNPNNVEIEGGEFIQLPNFDTEVAEGPSHERGGVETSLPEGTRVYSHHLKPEGSKKTFAQLAKKHDITEYKKVIDNPFKKQVDKDTATLMMQRSQKVLDELFEEQQRMNGDSNGEMMQDWGQMLQKYDTGGKTPKAKLYTKSNTVAGRTTPTGQSSLAPTKTAEEYLKPWIGTIPGIEDMSEGEAQAAIYDYALKNNPESVQNMWTTFGNTNKGKEFADLVKMFPSGKISKESLTPEVLATLRKAYIDNKLGARTLVPQKSNVTIPDVTGATKIGVDLGKVTQKETPKGTPQGNTYEMKDKPVLGKYTRTPFDAAQLVPSIYNLAEAQTLTSYGIPEIDAPYLRPQTLNIQSELQDVDSMTMAALRAGADPNTAYIAALDAKQKAYQTKQNYDAANRYETDVKNAGMMLDADVRNAAYQGNILDTLIPAARDAQSTQKSKGIQDISNLYGNWNSNESDKEFFYNNLIPSFNLDASTDNIMDVADKTQKLYDRVPKTTTQKKTGKKGLLAKNKVSLNKYKK